jgi:hypothetical protein
VLAFVHVAPGDLDQHIASAVGADGGYRTAFAGFQACCPGENEDIYVAQG